MVHTVDNFEVPATVIELDCYGLKDNYFDNKVESIEGHKKEHSWALKEDDEHSTTHGMTGRERWPKAIEQNCGYMHFEFLVILVDIMSFRDFLLSKTIELVGYDALLWLKIINASVNLNKIRDAEGTNCCIRLPRELMQHDS